LGGGSLGEFGGTGRNGTCQQQGKDDEKQGRRARETLGEGHLFHLWSGVQ
jgi:hypothetical protein